MSIGPGHGNTVGKSSMKISSEITLEKVQPQTSAGALAHSSLCSPTMVDSWQVQSTHPLAGHGHLPLTRRRPSAQCQLAWRCCSYGHSFCRGSPTDERAGLPLRAHQPAHPPKLPPGRPPGRHHCARGAASPYALLVCWYVCWYVCCCCSTGAPACRWPTLWKACGMGSSRATALNSALLGAHYRR